MKTYIFAVLMAVATIAQADEASYADKSKAVAEALLKSQIEKPTVESATVYARPGPFGNVCGIVSGVNRYGQRVSAYFVVSDSTTMPLYLGPIPPTSFKKSCSGNEVK